MRDNERAMGPLIDHDQLRRYVAEERHAWGLRVLERRKQLGMSQADVASLLGVRVQTISKIERGEIVPRDYLRIALAMALSVEVSELFFVATRSEITRAVRS